MIDLTPILQALVALGGTIITCLVIPWIKGKVCAERLERLQVWARIAVKAAEQLHPGPGKGAEKKAAALAFLNARGITFDIQAMDALVECEVNELVQSKDKEG